MINLRTYNLEALDRDKHYKVISKLQHDSSSCKYVSRNIARWLSNKEPVSKDMFEIGKAYVLVKDNKYIGIIGAFKLDRNKVVELWCSILPDDRNKGHASKFLGEITMYLIDNVLDIDDIRLKINIDNEYSNKTAVDNGYNFLYKEDNINVYQYFKEANTKRGKR